MNTFASASNIVAGERPDLIIEPHDPITDAWLGAIFEFFGIDDRSSIELGGIDEAEEVLKERLLELDYIID